MAADLGNGIRSRTWSMFIGVACCVIAISCWSVSAQVQRLGQPPVAFFTWSPCPAYDAPIIFDASGSRDADGEIVLYMWKFDDGVTAEGMIVQHNLQEGAHVVFLTVVDNDSLVNDLKRHIAVDDICRSSYDHAKPPK